jgi:hypothetical protein
MPLITRQKTTRVAPAHHIGHPGKECFATAREAKTHLVPAHPTMLPDVRSPDTGSNTSRASLVWSKAASLRGDPYEQQAMRECRKIMRNDLGAGYGEHRRADAQTSCHSAGSSNSAHCRTEPLFITGNKTRDAALGGPRIRAGEIIGWRVWNLYNGLLHSVFVPYIWHPGIFERTNSKRCGYYNHGYHAFRDK